MSHGRLVLTLCVAEVLGMAGFATLPALLPGFIEAWRLTNTQAGWIAGIYDAGYMVSVPLLGALTDRVDPRRIYLAGTALGGIAALSFALFADGLWSALSLRCLAGIGLAGTYMPGLKALSDRIEGPAQARAVAFYTATFGVGVSLSFFLAGEIAVWLDWRYAFGAAALGSLAAFVIIARGLPPSEPVAPGVGAPRLLDFRPVLRARPAMGFILAYAAHVWELFALRSWLVTFLVYSQSLQGGAGPSWNPTWIVAIANLLGLPSSVLGNELAVRFGRRRVITLIMLASAALAVAIGFNAALPFVAVALPCLLYGITTTGDSASITAGAVAAAPPGARGATMAVHSTLGAGAGFLGSLSVGVVLDLAAAWPGLAWGLAFATMGAGALLGPVALAIFGRPARVEAED